MLLTAFTGVFSRAAFYRRRFNELPFIATDYESYHRIAAAYPSVAAANFPPKEFIRKEMPTAYFNCQFL